MLFYATRQSNQSIRDRMFYRSSTSSMIAGGGPDSVHSEQSGVMPI
jgi:hypothetical protein